MSANPELFALSASTPAGSPLHGAALVSARAGADARFRRGIDLHAGFDLEANVEGEYRQGLVAELQAGASVSGGLAFQAASPLDLFDEAGLVLRLQAKLEAAAWVSASLGLDLETFRVLITDRLGPGPLTELIGLLLDESVVQAGFWARAAFAAELHGEASITGSLLPSARHGAGFSFALNYGAGFGYGTGMEFRANIGFDDPRRLMGRMADKITDLTVAEASKLIATLPEADRPLAEQALTLLRPLLTMSTRAAFEIGIDLATTSADRAQGSATAAILQSLADQVQKLFLDTAVELAASRLKQLFVGHDAMYAFLDMEPAERDVVALRATAVKEAAVALAEAEFASAPWLRALEDLADPLEDLVDAGLFTGDLQQHMRTSLGVLGAAASLLTHVLTEPPGAPSRRDPLAGATPAPVEAADVVGRALDAAPGATLALADLAGYLVGEDVLTQALRRFPELGGLLSFLAEALGVESPDEVLREVLISLDRHEGGGAEKLLARVAPALGRAVEQRVVPELFDPIKRTAPAEVDRFLDQVVIPTLVALPAIVLPRVPELGSREAQLRLREGVSAVLLQSLNRFVLETADVLIEHALDHGAEVLRDVAADIERFQHDQPAFTAVAALAAQAWLPLRVLPDDVIALLDLAADTLDHFNRNQREDLIALLEAAVMLGLDDPEARAATATAIATTDDPIKPAALDAALQRVGDGALDLVGYVVPRALVLAAMHFANEVETIAAAIYEGAKAVVAAVEQGIELLAQGAEWLAQKVGELAAEVARLAADIAGDIKALATRLSGLVSEVVNRIRAFGWSLLSPLVDWAPGWVKNAFRDLYNGLFDALAWAIQAPLDVLASIAGWVEQALTTQLQGAAVDGASIQNAVRNRVLAASAYDLHFDLRIDFGWPLGAIDLGRVTIPAGNVLGFVASVAFDEGTLARTVDGCAGDAVALRNAEIQRGNLQAQLDGQLSELQAKRQFGDLTPGRPLSITISDPREGEVYGEDLTARIIIAGANRSFVESPLGVPRRVSLRLNGREYAYTPAQWQESADSIAITLVIKAETPESAPLTPQVLARLEDMSGATVAREGTTSRARVVTEPAEGPVTASLRSGDRVVGRVERGVAAVSPRRIDADAADSLFHTVGALRREQFGVVAPHPRGMASATVLAEALEMEAPPPAIFTSGGPGGVPSGRPGLNVLQVAVSDAQERTQHVSVTFYMAKRERAAQPDVVLEHIEFDPPGRDVAQGERVVLRSTSDTSIDMTGWRLRDLARHTFTFPHFTLAPGVAVTVWTKRGTDDGNNLHWNRRAAVWNNRGDALILHDAGGREVTRYAY